ncbi:MAG TPA: S8 family serine peptidase [Solirubrobacterales bacterium]
MTSALFALAVLAPGGAAAASGAEGSLTPELERLSGPTLAEASPEEQAEALGLPVEGAGSLSREGERVVVEAHFEAGALQQLEALEEAGAKILVASREYQTVALSVEPEDLEAVAEVPGIDAVQAARRPQIYGTEGAATATVAPVTTCEGGTVIGQGVGQLNVEEARTKFGARGRGLTVGVLSDSFNQATKSDEGGPLATKAKDDEVSNDLPGPNNTCTGQGVNVRVIAEATPNPGEELHDEGRAMLQVIHDVAPHAELAFATAYGSELEFAHNIEKLAEPVIDGGAGANVIVDDVAYYSEPFFQEGPVANAIRRVTEAGVTYLTAAGNNNLFETEQRAGKTFLTVPNHEIGSWEREKFDDTECQGVVKERLESKGFLTAAGRCLNFSPTGKDNPNFAITVRPESKLIVDLQWAEPWYGVKSDLDAYLVNSTEREVLAPRAGLRPLDNVNEGGEEGVNKFSAPVEVLEWANASSQPVTVKLVVDRCSGFCNPAANLTAEPRVKVGILENGAGVEAVEYHESVPSKGITVGPTVFGHAGSSAAITVGAVNYREGTAPSRPENYSSRGPFTAYFEPVSGTSPAEALVTPEVVSKPDITATDCAKTTFFAWFIEPGAWEFCGTSEAAPHAAAVAALMKQADPLASPKGIREAMQVSATEFKSVKSPWAVGSGLLNAAKALTALPGSEHFELDDPPSVLTGKEGEPPHEEGGKGGSGSESEKEKEAELPTPTPTPPAPTPGPPPVVAVTKGPATVDNESRPTFEFSASQQVNFTCQIDGAAPQPCSSPYVAPTALSDGKHGFAVVGTDAEGRSGASNTYYFTVDTKAPRARIVGHPAKLVKTTKATYIARFRLTADQSPVTYYCQMDREPLRICSASMTAKVKPGSHVLKVRARDELGNTSVSPSTYRFRVKKTPPARSAR